MVYHSKISSFHQSMVEMSLTLNSVLCLLHLPIRGYLPDHFMIHRLDALDMMVEELGVDPQETQMDINQS